MATPTLDQDRVEQERVQGGGSGRSEEETREVAPELGLRIRRGPGLRMQRQRTCAERGGARLGAGPRGKRRGAGGTL